MKKKALITGITGQDGSYLAEFLLEKGYEVHGIIRRSSTFNFERIDHLHTPEEDKRSRIFMDYADLADGSSIAKIIQKIKPDEIYHLGAQSHVRISFDIPEYTADVTGLGTIRILEAIRELKIPTKFYQASSSELYGKAVETPQNENTPFYPRSPYACAKLYAYWVTKNYREAYNLFAVNGILFNHESPRRGENFVSRKITKTLCEIKKGIKDVLYLGNLNAKRDWGYAKDYVETMWLMMQQPEPEDYVIATGENHSVREFIEVAAKELEFDLEWQGKGVDEVGIDKNSGKIIIRINPVYFRPTEVDALLGDPTKARVKLGWRPKVTFRELVKLMVQEDMKKLEQKINGVKIDKLPEYSVYLKKKNGFNQNKKKIKIALIQPDSPFLTVSLSFPNLGLMYISSYLKKNGYSPDFYDLTGGVKLPKDLKADIFGFSCQITQFKDVVILMRGLRKNNPGSLFVIGGPFPTHSPEECLNAGFDIVVRGEGEIPMLEIVENYPNIKKREYTSEKFIDPNEIMPDWEAIKPLRYIYQLGGKRCINLITKRGNCPFQCTFCAKQEFNKSPFRFRTVENILAEVKILRDKYGFGSINIYDDDVFIDKKRDMEIFKGLKELGLKFRCMTRANLASQEDIKLLKEYGCEEVCIGVETADPDILEKVVKKGIKIDDNTEFVKYCKEVGLRVKIFLIIGLPSESRESVEKTRKWLRENNPDNFDLSIFTPYPGSDIYKNKKNYEIDWDEDYLREIWFYGEPQYEGCAVWTPYLSSKEILKLREEINQEIPRGKGGVTNYYGPLPQLMNKNNNSSQQTDNKNNKIKYYLNEPYLKGKEKEYVLDVLDSGWLSLKGKHTKIFEEKFAQMVGVEYALAVQSGTAALHTALLALGVGKGDKVVVPNFTCGGCATSIIQCGATPVILDVEDETFCLDVNKLNEFIKKEKPKAVILVHIYGFSARDIEQIVKLCQEQGILLLEDACEAHGAEFKGKKLGSFGDMSVFSVRSEKMIGVGEGGLVLTNNKELIDKAIYWACRAAPYRTKNDPYWYKYYYSGIGMNYLMPHLLGAVGRAQIENFPEILNRKRKVGEKYQSLLSNISGIKLQKVVPDSNPSYWLNIVLLENKSKKEVREIAKKLMENGVEIRPAFWPLGDQLPFRGLAFGTQEVGNYLFEHGLILPSSVFLSDNNCQAVEEIVKLLTEISKSVKIN